MKIICSDISLLAIITVYNIFWIPNKILPNIEDSSSDMFFRKQFKNLMISGRWVLPWLLWESTYSKIHFDYSYLLLKEGFSNKYKVVLSPQQND